MKDNEFEKNNENEIEDIKEPQQNGYYGYQNPYQNNWQDSQHYGNHYYNNPYPAPGWQPGNGQQGKGPEKKSGIGKKILLTACLGVFFGACAFGTFYALESIGGKTPEENAVAVDTPPIKETEEVIQEEKQPVYANVTDVSELVEKTMPAVVSVNGIYTYTGDLWGESYSQKYDGGGSGFIIGQNETELLLATNAHVVASAEDMEVTFFDEAKADAVTKGYNNDLDVAVIAVKLTDIPEATRESIAVARLGDSTKLKPGQAVISIGNALLLGQSVTTGVVSAVNMPIGGGFDEMGNQYGSDDRVMIQTTAFMNQGCSGGVLINTSGEVIGINTMAISTEVAEGMCYAIPISDAIPVLESLKTRETREKLPEKDSGYLGISCTNVGKQQIDEYGMPAGVYINRVYEDSAAEKAGLQKGDVIVALEGTSLKTVNELTEMLQYYPVGETVEVEIKRYEQGEYKSQIIAVRLGKRP